MKKYISTLLFICTYSISYGQLPNLIGEKATVKIINNAYDDYQVKSGRLLDVGSYNSDDNIYLNAEISVKSFMYDCTLNSNNNGVVNYILYTNKNLSESNFKFLKETVIKVHSASYYTSSSGYSIYTWRNGSIYFKWDASLKNGYVIFK